MDDTGRGELEGSIQTDNINASFETSFASIRDSQKRHTCTLTHIHTHTVVNDQQAYSVHISTQRALRGEMVH